MKEAQKNSKEALKDVSCILFDGRKDDTKVLAKGKMVDIISGYKGKALFTLQ